MLAELLIDNIYFSTQKLSWQEAISLAAEPLLIKKNITQNYIADMIKNVEKNGSYIILVPDISLPHASSNGNVLQTSMSFLKLYNPVIFPDGQSVSIMFVLASTSCEGHLNILTEFAEILIDKEKQNLLRAATTKREILNILN